MRKSKIFTLLIIVLIIGFGTKSIFSFGNYKNTLTDHKPTLIAKSKLKILMKKIHKETKVYKKQFANNNFVITDSYLEDLKQITKSGYSSENFDEADFNAYNDSLITKIMLLKDAKEKQIELFNNYIDACVACHTKYSPMLVHPIGRLKITE